MSPFSAESSRSCSTPRAACGSPSSEIVKERNKQTRREEHTLAIADAYEVWGRLHSVLAPDFFEGCRLWMPQASTLTTTWMIPPVFCTCLRRHHAVETYNIALDVNGELLVYPRFSRTVVSLFFQMASSCSRIRA